MEGTFPSYSLLAFIGSVEGIGAKLQPLRRCECCSSCQSSVGAGRRFREALKLVLPGTEVKYLAAFYEQRSKTVHEGRLHGDELTIGAWPHLRVFAPRPMFEEFRYQVVWKTRKASRLLLLGYLANDASGKGIKSERI
jgi:hypothetical protein